MTPEQIARAVELDRAAAAHTPLAELADLVAAYLEARDMFDRLLLGSDVALAEAAEAMDDAEACLRFVCTPYQLTHELRKLGHELRASDPQWKARVLATVDAITPPRASWARRLWRRLTGGRR